MSGHRFSGYVMCFVLGAALLLAAACSAPAPAEEPATTTMPPTATATSTSTQTATLTLVPPTDTPTPTLTLTPTVTPSPTATATFTPLPVVPGSYDVYVSAPGEDGRQFIYILDSGTQVIINELEIEADAQYIVRGGEQIYYHTLSERIPVRVNMSGSQEFLNFAYPLQPFSYFQLLPAINGKWLAWLTVSDNGTSYTVTLADPDGTNIREVGSGEIEAGSRIELLRVAIDGSKVFVGINPPGVAVSSIFRSWYTVYVIDTAEQTAEPVPGEPACGSTPAGDRLACAVHISPDGAYYVRALPPNSPGALQVTNLVTGRGIAGFTVLDVPASAIYEVGNAIFSPGGELVFIQAVGPVEIAKYYLVWANVVTGEQRVIADFGPDLHRPVGWAGDGNILLTNRQRGEFDTWQVNIDTGQARRVSGHRFIGHIVIQP